MKAKKEIIYSSRHMEVLRYFCELHFLQHTIQLLTNKISKNDQDFNKTLKWIKDTGHPTALNIVRFHYIDQADDLWSKDYNFSHPALKQHWLCGNRDVKNALKDPSWLNLMNDKTGVVIHEF